MFFKKVLIILVPVENVPAPWRFGLSGNLLTRTQFWREKCNAHIKRRFYKSLVTANEQKSSNLAVEAEDDQLLAAHCTFPLLASSWFFRVHWWSTECTHLTASIGLDFEYSLLPHFLFRIVVRLWRRSCHGVLSKDLIVIASSILVFCAQWLNDISQFGNLRITMVVLLKRIWDCDDIWLLEKKISFICWFTSNIQRSSFTAGVTAIANMHCIFACLTSFQL